MIFFVSVCSAQGDLTRNQRKTLHHFHSKKRLIRNLKGKLSHKYVRPRGRGYVMDGSINISTRRKIVSEIVY